MVCERSMDGSSGISWRIILTAIPVLEKVAALFMGMGYNLQRSGWRSGGFKAHSPQYYPLSIRRRGYVYP
jgi:hypothetical protein